MEQKRTKEISGNRKKENRKQKTKRQKGSQTQRQRERKNENKTEKGRKKEPSYFDEIEFFVNGRLQHLINKLNRERCQMDDIVTSENAMPKKMKEIRLKLFFRLTNLLNFNITCQLRIQLKRI
jgi:hypothetical protein